MMHGLTPRQSELLTFIKEFDQSHGYMPSYVEMKDALGLASKCSISRLVDALEERGRSLHSIGGAAMNNQVLWVHQRELLRKWSCLRVLCKKPRNEYGFGQGCCPVIFTIGVDVNYEGDGVGLIIAVLPAENGPRRVKTQTPIIFKFPIVTGGLERTHVERSIFVGQYYTINDIISSVPIYTSHLHSCAGKQCYSKRRYSVPQHEIALAFGFSDLPIKEGQCELCSNYSTDGRDITAKCGRPFSYALDSRTSFAPITDIIVPIKNVHTCNDSEKNGSDYPDGVHKTIVQHSGDSLRPFSRGNVMHQLRKVTTGAA